MQDSCVFEVVLHTKCDEKPFSVSCGLSVGKARWWIS